MGAWGSGPLENDTALDFLASLKHCRKAKRAAKVDGVLMDYLAFDLTLQSGENMTVMGVADIEEMRRSRSNTLAWYAASGQSALLDLLPELASEESWEALVQASAAPQVDDGAHEAFCAIAASHAIVEALAGAPGPLLGCEPGELAALARRAREVLALILRNDVFKATWQDEDYAELAASLATLSSRLGAAG